jgi:ATP-dependent Clp protease ATP-binding subunit ClpX
LRSILEHALLEVMFELPSMEDKANIDKVVVDGNTIIECERPMFIEKQLDKAS